MEPILAHIATALGIIAAMIYFWGAASFLVLRLIWPEKEPSMKRFLDRLAPFFAGRLRSQLEKTELITRKMVKDRANQGWAFAPLCFVCLDHKLTLWNLLISFAALFFGGLFKAYAWYGLRCLRLLNLHSYPALGFDGGGIATPLEQQAQRATEIARNRRAFVMTVAIFAAGLIGGNLYMFFKAHLFPWWMALSTLIVFALVTYRLHQKLIKEP